MDDLTAAMRRVSDGCPHVNRNDPRCATRFSLGRIDQAFDVCFGAYHVCPMYHRINVENAPAPAAERPVVAISISQHARTRSLCATGT
jgi:hypothetical protein